MSTVTVDLDIGMWLDPKGTMVLYVGDDPKPVESIHLLELVRMSVQAHTINVEPLDRDDAKKFVKLKKELVKCLNYLDGELNYAK